VDEAQQGIMRWARGMRCDGMRCDEVSEDGGQEHSQPLVSLQAGVPFSTHSNIVDAVDVLDEERVERRACRAARVKGVDGVNPVECNMQEERERKMDGWMDGVEAKTKSDLVLVSSHWRKRAKLGFSKDQSAPPFQPIHPITREL
jgi:hypothetical protein